MIVLVWYLLISYYSCYNIIYIYVTTRSDKQYNIEVYIFFMLLIFYYYYLLLMTNITNE